MNCLFKTVNTRTIANRRFENCLKGIKHLSENKIGLQKA